MSKAKVSIISMSNNIMGHAHDNAQIIFPLEGIYFIKSDQTEYTVDTHSLAVIPPEVMHYYNGSDGNKVLMLDFPKKSLKLDDLEQLKDIQLYFMNEHLEYIKNLLLLECDKETSKFSIDYLFYYLYDLLLSKPNYASIEYIFSNYDRQITIKELADIEHYSENYYREWFKKKTGYAPSAYIQRLRIEKAKELLITTKYSISDIAYMVGFSHHSSFTRAFNELEGLYPKNYRNEFYE